MDAKGAVLKQGRKVLGSGVGSNSDVVRAAMASSLDKL